MVLSFCFLFSVSKVLFLKLWIFSYPCSKSLFQKPSFRNVSFLNSFLYPRTVSYSISRFLNLNFWFQIPAYILHIFVHLVLLVLSDPPAGLLLPPQPLLEEPQPQAQPPLPLTSPIISGPLKIDIDRYGIYSTFTTRVWIKNKGKKDSIIHSENYPFNMLNILLYHICEPAETFSTTD